MYYLFYRIRLNKIWHCLKKSFFGYLYILNQTLEHACDVLMESLFKFIDKYTILIGQVSYMLI